MSLPEPYAILLVERGEPTAVLGYAVKKRRGPLDRALRRVVRELMARHEDLTETTAVEYGRGTLTAGPVAVCFDDARIAPQKGDGPPATSTERARAHRRRKRYGLEPVTLEVPTCDVGKVRELAAELVRRRMAEVDGGPDPG